MNRFIRHFQFLFAALLGGLWFGSPVSAQEVIILSSHDRTIEWLKQENWWGEVNRGEQLQVPRVLITAITERWKKNAPNLPVPEKKEIFYRFLAPLVLHAMPWLWIDDSDCKRRA